MTTRGWKPALFLGAAMLLSLSRPAPAAAQNAEDPASVKSPEVLPDGRVTFRLLAPKADAVQLTGDWMDNNRRNSSRSATREANGVWSITEGPLPPDYYVYSFRVDGVAALDPKNPVIKNGNTFNHNILKVPGPETAFEDDRAVPHGQVRMAWYPSGVTGTVRRIHVYTPPGYDGNASRYPVLYLIHGGGDNDSGWTTGGRVNFILDNLLAEGKAKPMIVVMPDWNLGVPAAPQAGQSAIDLAAREQDAFAADLTGSIMPWVESNFRTLADRDHRAIAGLSMGGARTLRIGPSRTDLFSYIGVFSMGLQKGQTQGVPDDFEQRNAAFLANAAQTNMRVKLFWIGVGDHDDRIMDGGRTLDATLTRYGVTHEFHESTGGHSWLNWRRYLHQFAPRLFR
ncbi:esterase [Novosphingobium flavum]|uniref:Esterase n=1 Tax=Novosphingobium flavum TaxID=1778672 RepID=A0A7X1FNC9_9SPHN|nr:esterase [Novosphingobium flavum]MBC2663918.1 esterase [Novosphingobium flavum]